MSDPQDKDLYNSDPITPIPSAQALEDIIPETKADPFPFSSFKPLQNFSFILLGLMGLFALINLTLVGIFLYQGPVGLTEPDPILDPIATGIDWANTGLMIFSIVIWCIWQFRLSINVRCLGASQLKCPPVLAIVYWFIPILNLFRPYQAMQELWKASDPNSSLTDPIDWQNARTGGLVGTWWLAWILSIIFGVIVDQIAQGLATVQFLSLSDSELLLLILCVYLIFDTLLCAITATLIYQFNDRILKRHEKVAELREPHFEAAP